MSEVALDDDDYLIAEGDGEYLWVRPCGLDGVMLRPGQQRRLLAVLLTRHRAILDTADRKVLEALMHVHPNSLPPPMLALATGYQSQSSTMSVALSRLRRLGLVVGYHSVFGAEVDAP